MTVSSIAHHQGRADVLDGNPAERYNPPPTYGNSKLANLLFALELQRRASLAGVALTSTAAHPGVASTPAGHQRAGARRDPGRQAARAAVPQGRLPVARRRAREPTLYAATAATPGSYTGPQTLRGVARQARARAAQPARPDEALAGKLWAVSEDLTGVRYDWETSAT